jgi:ribosomal protein L25 (general stress protein Ctc)
MKLYFAENQIPGIIYGKDPAKLNVPGAPQLRRSVYVDQRDVLREFRRLGTSIENTLFEIVLDDGSSYEVTPRQLQVHPSKSPTCMVYMLRALFNCVFVCIVSEMPLSMNYLVYRPGSILRVPFKYINEEDCVDMKRGSFLVHVNRFVEVVCEPGADIPQFVQVDLASADRFTAFNTEKFILPPGAKLHHSVPKSFVSAVLKSASGN